MKYALTYLAGAVTVTGFVLATGGNTATAFWLGFALAIVSSVLVVYGFRKRCFSHKPVKLEAVKKAKPVKKLAPMSASLAEIEATSALQNFGAPKAQAMQAVKDAYRPGMTFETLFRMATAGLQKRAA